jgi:hypothetical protein
MPFLHHVREMVIRGKARTMLEEGPRKTDVQEEMLGKTGKNHWNKEPRFKTAIISGKQNNTQQDLQEDHRAGDNKANSQDLC